MSEDELASFPVGDMAETDCHLFCWTTQRFWHMAFRLLERWGFWYVCQFVWHKSGGFQVINLPQYNCEFVLYGRRGAPQFIDAKQFFCCFGGERRQHSRKPDAFYDMIRRVTAGPRIDVFSREPREGFDQYGNETQKFTALAPTLSHHPSLDQPAEDLGLNVSRIDISRLRPPTATSDLGSTQDEETDTPALPAPLATASDAVAHGAL